MNLKQAKTILEELDALKASSGKRFKEITEMLSREATTENLSQAKALLESMK